MGLYVPSSGDPHSKIWIVGEAPGQDEELAGIPFIGASGRELDLQLAEAGIDLSQCFVTNVSHWRPPDNDMSKWLQKKVNKKAENGFRFDVHPLVEEGKQELLELIERHRPLLIIGLGNTALWALTGQWGIGAWRGSEIELKLGVHFVPTLHPAAVLRNWASRPEVMQDLKFRCKRRLDHGFVQPKWQFITYPSFAQVMEWIAELSGPVAADIETSQGKTVCLGLARSSTEAICIPFQGVGGRYWEADEERAILAALEAKIASGACQLIGQNWAYDRQYLEQDFGVNFFPHFDTYIAQSILLPGTERGLGYLSSMYCSWHSYWKEDGKEWAKGKKDFDKEFRYNCRDACATWEVASQQREALEKAGLTYQFRSRMNYGEYVYRMMRRGVLRDEERTAVMLGEVNEAIHAREIAVANLAGHPVNFASPKQVSELLFKEMGFKPVGKKTSKGAASTKDEALRALVEKQPDAESICTPILEARSLASIRSNFLEAEIDPDGRFRCSWMATGTETFRLTSGQNAFHRGGPLQNITDGKHTHSGRRLPNLRSTIVPPVGCVYWNCDLERADVQVVAWEAEDESLKKMLRDRVDIHLVNAVDLFDIKGVPYEECFESHSRYKEHKERHEQPRHFAKAGVHLCVDEQHEALTRSGWKAVAEIQDGEEILVAQLDGTGAYFTKIDSWFRGPCNSEMIRFEGEAVDQCVTVDHRMSYSTDDAGFRVGVAGNLPKSARLPKSVWFDGEVRVKRPALLCAFHADGSISERGNVTFHFRKQRKIERLRALLVGCPHTESKQKDGTTVFYIPHRFAEDLRTAGKVLTVECLNWSHADAVTYLQEQVFWDGHQGETSQWMCSVKEEHAKLAHTLAHLHGFGSQVNVAQEGYAFRWSLNNRTLWRLGNCKQTKEPAKGRMVYCPVTPTGFWLTRRNGKISLTGNTNYGGTARTMAIKTHSTVKVAEKMQARWFDLHPGIKRWHQRVKADLLGTRTVRNKFGYRRVYFDRIESAFNEALAWVPQSSVSIVISLMHMEIEDAMADLYDRFGIELQVHDSLSGYYAQEAESLVLPRMYSASRKVIVPYDDPLWIPLELSTSMDSWGEVQKRIWPTEAGSKIS